MWFEQNLHQQRVIIIYAYLATSQVFPTSTGIMKPQIVNLLIVTASLPKIIGL